MPVSRAEVTRAHRIAFVLNRWRKHRDRELQYARKEKADDGSRNGEADGLKDIAEQRQPPEPEGGIPKGLRQEDEEKVEDTTASVLPQETRQAMTRELEERLEKRVRTLYQGGMHPKQIADKIGMSTLKVMGILRLGARK